MTTVTQIGNVGERAVAYWLKYNGYSTNIDARPPGSTDIEANILEGRGNTKRLLVQIKTAMQPEAPGTLCADEERNLIAHATRLGCEAWEARVQLDQQMRQVGQVQWRRLR